MLGSIRRPEEEEVFEVQDWAEVHRLNRQGVPKRAIARRLGMFEEGRTARGVILLVMALLGVSAPAWYRAVGRRGPASFSEVIDVTVDPPTALGLSARALGSLADTGVSSDPAGLTAHIDVPRSGNSYGERVSARVEPANGGARVLIVSESKPPKVFGNRRNRAIVTRVIQALEGVRSTGGVS